MGAAADGHTYFVKGPDLGVITAEAVGYALAEAIGLQVPHCAWWWNPETGEPMFASRDVGARSCIPELIARRDLVDNPEFLGTCIAFDHWVANPDRNEGNIVAEPCGGRESAHVRLHAIDFESSLALNGESPLMIAPKERPRWCWPRDSIAALCAHTTFPVEACRAIAAVTASDINRIFLGVSDDLGRDIPWRERTVSYLASRAQRIVTIAEEAWHAA